MKRIGYTVIFALMFSSCDVETDENSAAPSACFTVDHTSSTDPAHYFIFTNCSDNYITPSWDFDDGYYSSEHSPIHTFNHIGEYNVKLIVSNADGMKSTNTRTIIIGHYTLTKIVYNQLNSTVNYPRHVYL